MIVTLDQTTRTKIERRARRAFSAVDSGETNARFHRISYLTSTGLTYRVRHKTGQSYRGGPKVKVVRGPAGEPIIDIPLPPTPTVGALDLLVTSDLEKLKGYTGRVRAYKVTKADGTGTQFPGLNYEVGAVVEELRAVTDVNDSCAAGVNLGTAAFAKGERGGRKDRRVFAVEFDAQKDIAAIPNNTDGKFRVFRCLVVEELDGSRF